MLMLHKKEQNTRVSSDASEGHKEDPNTDYGSSFSSQKDKYNLNFHHSETRVKKNPVQKLECQKLMRRMNSLR